MLSESESLRQSGELSAGQAAFPDPTPGFPHEAAERLLIHGSICAGLLKDTSGTINTRAEASGLIDFPQNGTIKDSPHSLIIHF